MEAKPFASLSSGLLARKGAARPAMRPQGFGQAGGSLEDLGWNDMGFEPPKPAALDREVGHEGFGEAVVGHPRAHPTGLTPVQSPVHEQQAEIVGRLTGVDETVEPVETLETVGIPDTLKALETVEDEAAEPPEQSEVQPTEVPKVAEILAKPSVAAAPARRRAPRARAAAGSKGKAAFTLRLDPERHLKLRLACAVDGRSAQQLVTDALDQLLERMPEVDGLAEKAKRRG